MTTFVLVHGVCAGGWCWEPLTQELRQRGHTVVAPDLPCDDPTAGLGDYATTVERAVGDAGDVVVVGHSTSGLVIPLVAARRPVRELVYLCALVPSPGKSQLDEGFDFRGVDVEEWQVDNGDGSFSVRPGALLRHIAQDADPVVADAAEPWFRRQYYTPFLEPCPLDALPDVASRYILCRDDHLVRPEWSRQIARDRLGVVAEELPGSHSPMVSRPNELADALMATALP